MSEKLVSGWVQLINLVKTSGVEPDEVAELISDRLHLQLGNTVASKAHHERQAQELTVASFPGPGRAEADKTMLEAAAKHKIAAGEDNLYAELLQDTLGDCAKIHTDGGALWYGTREEFEELLQALYCDEGDDTKVELRFVREDGCITFQGTIRSEDIKEKL